MPMTTLQLHSTKYNGSLHYRYLVQQIDRTDERLVTYFQPGTPVESHRGPMIGTRHVLSFFWPARPYVLHVEWDAHWNPHHLYVDIATATTWLDGTIRYIDLDLDLILRPNAPSIHLDDADEFETHRHQWNYPDALVKNCWSAVTEARTLLESNTPPFSPTLYTWRPGSPLSVAS